MLVKQNVHSFEDRYAFVKLVQFVINLIWFNIWNDLNKGAQWYRSETYERTVKQIIIIQTNTERKSKAKPIPPALTDAKLEAAAG